MEKKTLFALVAVVALGAGAYFAMRAPEKGERVGPAPRPVATFKSAEVTHLELTTEKQEKTTLDKKDGAGRVTAPHDWPADQAGVKSLLDGLDKLAFGDIVTENKDKHEELGVVDGKAAHLVAKSASGKTLADLIIGKAISGFTMVRPAGKDEVWQATGLYGYMLSRDPKTWRDHGIFSFTAADATRVSIESAGDKLVLDKEAAPKDAKDKTPPGTDAKWKIASATGEAPKTSEALDTAQVTGLVQAMAALRANDFADSDTPDKVGLDKPRLTVSVTAAGKSYTLLLGEAKGEDVYAKAADQPTLYTLKKYVLDRIDHPPADYRDKTLTKIKEADLAAIDLTVGTEHLTLTHDGDAWKAKGQSLDATKVKPLAGAFENLSGAGFAVGTDAAALGLKKPDGEVALHLKDKTTVSLKIGALTKDGAEYYVEKAGSPVMRVKKYLVERFLKKPSDLGVTKVAKAEKGKKK